MFKLFTAAGDGGPNATPAPLAAAAAALIPSTTTARGSGLRGGTAGSRHPVADSPAARPLPKGHCKHHVPDPRV